MYFSVKTPIKMLGKVYTPCVCYAVTEVLVLTVEKLEKEGKAYIYKDKVTFQNGKVLVKKEAVVKENLTTEVKKSKKKVKEEKTETEETEGF